MTPEQIRAIARLVGGQCALARILGVDARTVRRWVAGDRAPNAHNLLMVAMVRNAKK